MLLAAEPDQTTELAGMASPPQQWCIVTCEYPPLAGGVSDHTYLLAGALAAAGDAVDVWCPPAAVAPPTTTGVAVHVLPSHFGLDALRVLRRTLRALPPSTRVLVQYVPSGYGWRMMNLPFALLLFSLRKRGFDLYVHEVAIPMRRGQTMRRNLAGAVHAAMAWLVTRGARHVFITIPEWQRRLARLGARAAAGRRDVIWVPVPSNVPDSADLARVDAIRRELLRGGRRSIVGHFGTFGRFHTALLGPTMERLLDDDASRLVLLIGRNGSALRHSLVSRRPELAARIVATDGLEPAEVSAHLAACDVLVQPYEDGVSDRRGSLMAGVALGKAIVGNRGEATSELWTGARAVLLTNEAEPGAIAIAVSALLADPARREALGHAARRMYAERFALERGVALVRGAVDAVHAVHEPRVLMFHTTLPEPGRKPGGVEVAVHRLANALVQIGVPVTVASLTAAPADARYQHRHLFARWPWLRDSHLGRLVVLPMLLNRLDVNDADVVHFHGDDWFVARRPRATVRTLHGTALREAQQATRLLRRLEQYLLFPMERIAARLATISVAVGRDAAMVHGNTRVIGNGVDHALFRPGTKSDHARILYVGTWEGRKRGRWLYELFVEQIAPLRPDVELHFIADREPP
ncbi:MAG: glycosyltransferase, partial [Gemmatimonadaceae bacterium]